MKIHTSSTIKSDTYHQLTRGEQVIIFRLRTNHNRLKHHLFHKFRIGETDQCTCSTDSQTGNHILQSCPLLEELRKKHWPGPTSTSVNQKLYGSLEDLRRTAAFVCETGLTIWWRRSRVSKKVRLLSFLAGAWSINKCIYGVYGIWRLETYEPLFWSASHIWEKVNNHVILSTALGFRCWFVEWTAVREFYAPCVVYFSPHSLESCPSTFCRCQTIVGW